MIGQQNLQEQIKSVIENGSLARFIILSGERGSGRHTLSKEIAKWLNSDYVEVEKGVDAIRGVIENSYKVAKEVIYVIDGDNMSSSAKSSLLKVTEEPPNKARFILTVADAGQTLTTLVSRACVYRMDSYSSEDIAKFAGTDDWRFPNFCSNKYEVDLLKGYGIEDFHNFVKLVVDNIGVVSGANALKIQDKISVKDDDGKYDMKIFLQAFRTECVDRVQQFDEYPDKMKYLDWVDVTKEMLDVLRTPSTNKQMLFDMWVFNIRAVDYADR